MHPIRETVPARRLLPTKNPKKNWSLHKADLMADFNNHCAYCDSYDGFSHTYFEVDHFIPKNLIIKNGWPISLVQYTNLVYSCKFCNNSKLDTWPTNSAVTYNRYNKGFIDPCDINYDKHFYRTKSGEIRWQTKLGKWMYLYAFKFDERIEGIKLLWNLNRIRKALIILNSEILKYKKNSKKYNAIHKQIQILNAQYVPTHEELIDYYRKL
ncbi:MAG: HNH endonuclease signature motif containing protein [Flavobacterium sp.]